MRNFENPIAEIVVFEETDIITTSNTYESAEATDSDLMKP